MEELLLELEELRNKNKKADARVAELEQLVRYYEERLRLSQQKRFAASSEKSDGQRLLDFGLFDEAENEANPKLQEPVIEEITYKRRKQTGKRDDDLSELPVERVEHVLSGEERVCPVCGEQMHTMGHETRRELEIIPAQVRVVEHVREVCSCRKCEREGTTVPIIKATMPEPVIKGSIASASSIAHVMVQKYINAVPLYRQEQEFLQNGFLLSRQTMANWMLRAAVDWLEPLYALMRVQLLSESVLHADETVLQVLREPGRASRAQSFMWLYCTGSESSVEIALYEYQPTRSSTHPKRFLAEFEGYLHTDGYAGYNSLPLSVIHVGCWAHARRKFDEAVKSAPPEERENTAAQTGLSYCNHLFALEREYQNLSPEDRYTERIKRSKPILDAFFSWAKSIDTPPKSALGKGIHYALGQRSQLENVLLDGRLELSNNLAERRIKPFVIGRKNWLFSCTPKGARASAVIYSIIETAKANKLKPFAYLKHVLEAMPNTRPADHERLLPWSKSLPEQCRLNAHEEHAQQTEISKLASDPEAE